MASLNWTSRQLLVHTDGMTTPVIPSIPTSNKTEWKVKAATLATYLGALAGSIFLSTRNRLAMARNGNSPTPRNPGPQPYLSTMMPV